MAVELKVVGGQLEFYEGEEQKSVGGEMVAETHEDGKALGKALCDQTDFADKYAATQQNFGVLIHVAAKLNRNKPLPGAVTVSRILEAYRVADQIGGVCGDAGTLERLTEESAPILSRDELSGQFQNALDAEVKALIETNPREITRRSRIDSQFRAAVDRVMRPASPTAPPRITDPDLLEFVELWTKTPSPRAINGEIKFTGGKRYTVAEVDRLLERASTAQLIR